MRKWFRVATEGATTDGRKITRDWIEQMAASYDPAKYGSRIWLEHWRGLFADSAFKALGDVTGLKADTVEDGKLALFAELHPTDELLRINQQRQKIYTSIEVDPDFADSGSAYMVGLGVTDSPASLGTDMLQFSAQQGQTSPLTARKQRPENLFSAAVPIELDFSDADPDPEPTPKLIDQVKALFARHRDSGKAEFATFRDDLAKAMGEIVEQVAKLEEQIDPARYTQLATDNQALRQQVEQLSAEVKKLSDTPDTPPRTPSTGGSGEQRATF